MVEFSDIKQNLAPLLSVVDTVRFQLQLVVIGAMIRMTAIESPFTTELADGDLPALLGAQPNGAAEYLHSPPASYVDPVSPLHIAFGGPDGDKSNLLARIYHRAHAADWCAITTTLDLAALKVPAGWDPVTGGDRCQICAELVVRHLRVGDDQQSYNPALEPLCSALVPSPAYVYQRADDGDPNHAALVWCGCDENPDGGTDAGLDGSVIGVDGTGAGGAGVSSAGTGGTTSSNPGSGGLSGGAGFDRRGRGGRRSRSGRQHRWRWDRRHGDGRRGNGGQWRRHWRSWKRRLPARRRTILVVRRRPGAVRPVLIRAPQLVGRRSAAGPACAVIIAGVLEEPLGRPRRLDWFDLGDPHVTTLDGVLYDFQVVGEFVLVDDGAGFVVQTRQAPWRGSTTIARITGRRGARGVRPNRNLRGRRDPSSRQRCAHGNRQRRRHLPLPGGGSVKLNGGTYLVRWPNGDALDARVVGDHLDVRLQMARDAHGHLVGLLGDGNGATGDDLVLRDGTLLDQPVSAGDLYGRYASSWRLQQQESLFDYPIGLGTGDFTDLSFPSKVVTPAMLSSSDYRAAAQACTDNGVVMPTVLEACILDYGTTQDGAFIRGYQGMPGPVAVNRLAAYDDDFERGDDGAWTPSVTGEIPTLARLGPNHYNGPFTGEAVGFALAGLPTHAVVTVAFDLYVMGNWNDDVWTASLVGGAPLLSTTFSNGATAQAYPDIVGIGTHPAQTGAALVNALSAPGGGPPDAVYHVREIFPHTGARLAIEMQAPLLSAAAGASWGVDNVEVMLDAPVGFTTETTGGVTIVRGPAGDAAADTHTANLIVNGDAEAAVGSADGAPVAAPGWTTTGEATPLRYGASGYPTSTDPGPSDRGNNFFAGGRSDSLSTMAQTIDISPYAAAVDGGRVSTTLSGYFGDTRGS